MRQRTVPALAVAASVLGASGALAGQADVVAVQVERESGDVFRFDVTVEHADEGWNHYADAWEVVTPDGLVLGTRVLAHPHVNEQPFTRSLGGVAIPNNIATVIVRAHDSVHGAGGREQSVTLPR